MSSQSHSWVDLDQVEAVARSLAGAVTARRIYAENHQRTIASTDSLAKLLKSVALASGGFSLRISGKVLVFGGVPLTQDSTLEQLAARIIERESGGITFKPGVAIGAVTALVDWLSDRRAGPLREPLASIEVLPIAEDTEENAAVRFSELAPEFNVARNIHKTANTVVERLMDDIRAGRRADVQEIIELATWAADAAYSEGDTLLSPTQLPNFDAFTFNHSVNVFLISTTLLQPFARDRAELARFSQAALLHDVGKSKVPRDILFKEGRLTDEEFALIKKHPTYGAEILQKNKHLDPLAIEVAFCHHMRDHGHGYPVASLPIKTGPISNIVQVADMFEALTAHRPYSKGRSTAIALKKIVTTPGMASKRHAIAIMLQRFTASPPGSQVTLSSGEKALVLRTHSDAPGRPLVRVFEDAAGKPLAQPYEIDLRETDPAEQPIIEVNLKPNRPVSGGVDPADQPTVDASLNPSLIRQDNDPAVIDLDGE